MCFTNGIVASHTLQSGMFHPDVPGQVLFPQKYHLAVGARQLWGRLQPHLLWVIGLFMLQPGLVAGDTFEFGRRFY